MAQRRNMKKHSDLRYMKPTDSHHDLKNEGWDMPGFEKGKRRYQRHNKRK